MDIYFDGVRLGAVKEVKIDWLGASEISKAEARVMYMDREDVVLEVTVPPTMEEMEMCSKMF